MWGFQVQIGSLFIKQRFISLNVFTLILCLSFSLIAKSSDIKSKHSIKTESVKSSEQPSTESNLKLSEVSNFSEAKQDKKRQALAQGFTASEALMMAQSKWNFVLDSSAQRGLDEYTDTWFMNATMQVGYRLTDKGALGVALGFDTIAYKHGGSLFNNADPDPTQFGLSDLHITYTMPRIWYDQYNSLTWFNEVSLPTSRRSQLSGMTVRYDSSLQLRYSPFAKLIFWLRTGLGISHFAYETVDAFGSNFNSPLNISYSLGASYVITPKFTLSTSIAQTQRLDFDSKWKVIENLSASAFYVLSQNINLYLGYRWRDELVTNDPMFDAKKTILFTGASYVF